MVMAWSFFPRRFGRKARFVFMAFILSHFYIMFYSQHARPYALLFMFSVPFSFLFLEMSRRIWKERVISSTQWVYFGILSLLLCWTHYFGAILYGLSSIFLFAQALYFRRNIIGFVLVPSLVFLLFIPWLEPNLTANLLLNRFNGDWWINTQPPAFLRHTLFLFFFGTKAGLGSQILIILLFFYWIYKFNKQNKKFPFLQEIIFLFSFLLAFGVFIGLVYLKINLLLGRYYMEILPLFYLLFTLILTPLLRRSYLANMLLITVMGSFIYQTIEDIRILPNPYGFQAKWVTLYHQKHFPQKEMFVVAVDAYPPSSMSALFGFYHNHVFKTGIKVTALTGLEKKEREKALKRAKDAFIWMPHCEPRKLNYVRKNWEVATITHTLFLRESCFLLMTESGHRVNPLKWIDVPFRAISSLKEIETPPSTKEEGVLEHN
jgi:hypothetical protein